VQLNLSYTTNPSMNNGNIVGMLSSFLTADGQTHQMADVWFATRSIANANTSVQTDALSATQVAALLPQQADSLTTSLQAQVGGLVQAIESFSQLQLPGAPSSPVPSINNPAHAVAASGTVNTSFYIAGMVGAMQQFGNEGNPLAAPRIIEGVSTGTTSTASPLQNSSGNGILATGK
jgi:hypothetical protein